MKLTPLLVTVSLIVLLIGWECYRRSFEELETENARLRVEIAAVREQTKIARTELYSLEGELHRRDGEGNRPTDPSRSTLSAPMLARAQRQRPLSNR